MSPASRDSALCFKGQRHLLGGTARRIVKFEGGQAGTSLDAGEKRLFFFLRTECDYGIVLFNPYKGVCNDASKTKRNEMPCLVHLRGSRLA